MNNNNLGGNLRLLFADSCQIVLFLQTSRLNQSKTIPKGQDISSVLFKKKNKQGYFYSEFADFSQSFLDNFS